MARRMKAHATLMPLRHMCHRCTSCATCTHEVAALMAAVRSEGCGRLWGSEADVRICWVVPGAAGAVRMAAGRGKRAGGAMVWELAARRGEGGSGGGEKDGEGEEGRGETGSLGGDVRCVGVGVAVGEEADDGAGVAVEAVVEVEAAEVVLESVGAAAKRGPGGACTPPACTGGLAGPVDPM